MGENISGHTGTGFKMADQAPKIVPHAVGDQPSDEDLLGYTPYILAMSELLTNQELDTPFIVGIYGPWGTGKSTFMKLVNTKLEEAGLDTVFFHPWQFEDKEEVWKALIFSVLNYLEGQATRVERESDLFKRLVLGVGKLALDKSLQAITGDRLSLKEITSNMRIMLAKTRISSTHSGRNSRT